MPRYINMQDIHYQDNNDKNYYCMDFRTNKLIDIGDSIVGTPIVRSKVRGGFSSDLLIEDIVASGMYVFMWISSGTPNKTYKIEVETQTNNGLKLEGDGFLRIGD